MGTTSDKLTYLATTKDKLKTAINYTGANITNDTFRSYPEKLYNQYVDLVTNGTDTLYSNLPKVSASNVESATLNNTKAGKMQLTYKGNTQQDSTTGKNKFSTDFKTTDTLTTYTKIDSNSYSFTCSGTWKSATFVVPCKENTDYFFNYGDTSNGTYCYIKGTQTQTDLMGRYHGYFLTFNSGANTTLTITISNGNSSGITSGTLSNIQLEEGTTTTSFEKYSGGSPAPSPSYPFDIHNVSGDNTIEICGKNLFKEWISGTINPDTGVISSTARNLTNPIKVQPSSTYTLWREDTGFATYAIEFDKNDNWLGKNTISSANTTTTFTTNENTSYVRLYQYTSYSPTNKAQLEKSSTATAYEAYTGQSQLISLGVGNNKFNGEVEQGAISASTDKTYNEVKVDNTTRIRTKNLIILDTSKTYTISCKTGYDVVIQAFNENKKLYLISGTTNVWTSSVTFTNIPYIAVAIRKSDNSNIIPSEVANAEIVLNIGSSAIPYEPYSSIELNKIGNYQDYFYKTDKWYLHKEIGKYTFNSCNTATTNPSGETSYQSTLGQISDMLTANWGYGLSNYFARGTSKANNVIRFGANDKYIFVYTNNENFADKTSADSWLSTHNLELKYILATPTDTEITDTTLLGQLETIKRSYDGVTNISQENNDLPFILDVSALKEWE